MIVAACIKLVDTRPELDPTGSSVRDADQRFTGVSPSDQAAIEWALRCGERWGDDVHVICAGPPDAQRVLHDALACGATRATLVDLVAGVPSSVVASTLADHVRGSRLVFCGDHSADRGSGSTPAFLAASLSFPSALGLVEIEPGDAGRLHAVRRLDGGRREQLRVTGPAVCSVEGASARLRRAPLGAALASRSTSIERVAGPALAEHIRHPTRPFRPRARSIAAPTGATALDRIRTLTAPGAPSGRVDPVVLDPAEAADRILAALAAWGYIDP
jgi:electron transfer flavoprotein beta subunit